MPPDAMSAQLAQGAKTAALGEFLHCPPDRSRSLTGNRHIYRQLQGAARDITKRRQFRPRWRHDDGGAGIAPIAFQHRRHIDIEQVSRLNETVFPRHAMRRFVIEADAGITGEFVRLNRRRKRARLEQKIAPISSKSRVLMPASALSSISFSVKPQISPMRFMPCRSASLSIFIGLNVATTGSDEDRIVAAEMQREDMSL